MTSIKAWVCGLRCRNSEHLHIPTARAARKKKKWNKKFPKDELVKAAAGAATRRKQGTH